MKPKLFVGSSSESLDIAYAIQENLEYDADVTVWNQEIFSPSRSNLESLVDAVTEFNFAAFVFSPDDVIKLRDKEHLVPRDNVIFELGLFIGSIRRERCFVLTPKNVDNLHFPTDLLGLTPITFNSNRDDENYVAALGPACNKIRKAMRRMLSKDNKGQRHTGKVITVIPANHGQTRKTTASSTYKSQGFILNGTEHKASNAKEVLIQVFEALSSRDASFIQRFAALPKHGRKRRYVARAKEKLYPGRPDLVAGYSHRLTSGYWLGTNYSKSTIDKIIRVACDVAGIEYGKELQVML